MTSADPLPAIVLKRKAVVYIRQSTQAQVQTNLESQRRQYELVDVARRRGFRDVEVIDDDLGRSDARKVSAARDSGNHRRRIGAGVSRAADRNRSDELLIEIEVTAAVPGR
jgi:hypothetical protein